MRFLVEFIYSEDDWVVECQECQQESLMCDWGIEESCPNCNEEKGDRSV